MTDCKKQGARSLRTGCLAAGILLAAILTTLTLTYRCWLSALASALALDDPPRCAEAIVAVSGNHFRRQLAMDLYESGYGRLLIFNVSDTTYYFGLAIDPAASVLEEAGRRGIPGDSVVINAGVGSTYEDALATRETVQRLYLKSLLVVTSYFNCRRARFAYGKVMEGLGTEYSFCSVPP